MRTRRVARIASFLLTPEKRRLREPGARRLACAKAFPRSTGEEIAQAVALAVETVRAEATVQDAPSAARIDR